MNFYINFDFLNTICFNYWIFWCPLKLCPRGGNPTPHPLLLALLPCWNVLYSTSSLPQKTLSCDYALRKSVCMQTTTVSISIARPSQLVLSQFSSVCAPPPPSPGSFLLYRFPNWIYTLCLPCCWVPLKSIFILESTNNSVFNAELSVWICKNIYNNVGCVTLTRMNLQKLDFDFIVEINWISVGNIWWP